jgi:hypothetical protein
MQISNSMRSLIVLLGVLLGACTEAPPPAPVAQVPVGEPAFVGSGECRDCHEAAFEQWRGSHHDLAMQVANDSTVLGDFDDVSFEYFGTDTRFLRAGDDYVVRTQDADGEVRDFVVGYTFGVDPLQQYLVEMANGHVQPLPFAWDTRDASDGGQRWFHLYPDEYIGPGDALFWTGREQNWNYMCAECHSTNVQLNYDLASDRFETTWSEIDVGCEACHGPASNHVSAARAGSLPPDSALLVDLADRDGVAWRMNLDTGIAERQPMAMRAPQQPEACGRCHARRGVITADYEFGQPLADTHRVALLTEPLYYPDGQIRDEVFVYGSFVQSRMYQAGVTCSDCHNPHSLKLHTGPDPDLVCAQCHLPARFAASEHHGHEAGQVACVDCHMPATNYMVVDPRRDHSLRVPRPDLSQETGAPNACTMCHDDRDAAWATAAAREWWGEPASPAMAESGIRRATELATLAAPLPPQSIAAVERGLVDPDPLVRMAAARVAPSLPPERVLLQLAPLLEDDVLSVRLEAVNALAPARDYLPPVTAAAFDRAADEYRASQDAIASRPQAHGALAEFEGRLGNIEQALAHANQGVAMDPDMALLRHSRGLLLVRANRHSEALEDLRRAAELAPDVARFSYVYAVALNSLGDPAAARQVLEDAAVRHPDDPDIAAFLVMLQAD